MRYRTVYKQTTTSRSVVKVTCAAFVFITCIEVEVAVVNLRVRKVSAVLNVWRFVDHRARIERHVPTLRRRQTVRAVFPQRASSTTSTASFHTCKRHVMQVCTAIYPEQAVGFCSSSRVNNDVTDRRTDDSNVTLCNVNGCSLLVNTRSNQNNTAITKSRVAVNSVYSSFNSCFRVRNAMTFIGIVTVYSINIDDFF